MVERSIAVAAWESLFRAQVGIMRTLAANFPSKEISLNEYDVLFNLSRQPDRRLRLRELNQNVLLTQPSVSRLVDRLTTRGYLHKHTDPHDGRGAIIELTDAGFLLFRRVAVRHMECIADRIGEALSPAELTQLTVLCDKLRTDHSAGQATPDNPGAPPKHEL